MTSLSAKKLHNAVLALPWQDAWTMAMNADLLRSNWEQHVKGTSDATSVKEVLDCMTWSSGLRDYTKELLEARNKESRGIIRAADLSKRCVSNFEAASTNAVKEYNLLRVRYPQYTKKIEECVGQGLANLHQSYAFEWDECHKWFF